MTKSEASQKRVEKSKLAVEEMIRSANRMVLSEKNTEKTKIIIEGRVSAISAVKTIISRILNDLDADGRKWAKEKVEELINTSWLVYDTILDMLSETIDNDFNDERFKIICQGKEKAFEQSQFLLNSIQDLEEAMSETGLEMKEATLEQRFIEKHAKTIYPSKLAKK
jgi:hypothetical protein